MTKLIVGNQKFNLDKEQSLTETAFASFEYTKADGSARSFKNVRLEGVKITSDNNALVFITENEQLKAMRLDRIISPKVEIEAIIVKQ